MQNPYTVLEIEKTASKEEISQAYRKLAKVWHPDKNKAPEAGEKFKEINDAHNYLMDDTKRDFLNRHGRRMDDEEQAHAEAQNGNPFAQGGFPFGPGFPFGQGGFSFGQSQGFSFQMGPNPEQIKEMKRKQLHIKINIELSLEQIYTGLQRTLKYPRVRVVKGVQKQEEGEVEIDIKPGVHSNSQIEIKNKGHIIVEDDSSELIGSIIIIISEKTSTIYERDLKKKENLIYKHKLSFVEALCGFTLEIPHPSGKTLLVESNELINGLSQYKINNKGLPVFNRGKTYGDIIFKFEIVYPNEITEEQKEKLATLFNYKNKECSKPETEIITGNLILSVDDETESENDDNNVQQGQSVQCAQS